MKFYKNLKEENKYFLRYLFNIIGVCNFCFLSFRHSTLAFLPWIFILLICIYLDMQKEEELLKGNITT